MSNTKGREVLRGKLSYRRKGNNSWKKRAVTAYSGIESSIQPPKTPAAQILLHEDYEKVGQKPKNTIKLEEAKIDSSYSNPSAYSSTIASPQGGVRLSASPGGYSSGGSGSGVVGSGSGSGTIGSSGAHVFIVTTKNGEVHEFRTDTENDRLRWVKLLQLLVMFPRSAIPEEPKSNPIKDTFRLRLEAVQYGANSVWPVYILPEEVGGRCSIIGTNVLALKSGVPGKQVGTLNIYNPADPTTPLVIWDRDKMRRTGKTGNLVFVEIGRRCQGGPGLVWMYSGFNDAQALRETLHNFLFKGDGNAVAIPTQPSTLYDTPRASFDSSYPSSYKRENSIGSIGPTNPILSRSRSNEHDSGFVGSPGSFVSPKLEGPPVRLDKHPSIRRKRDSSKPREIRRSSSVTSSVGSFSETSARSGDWVEPIFGHDDSSSPPNPQSRSHSPQDECDGDVVGAMDPDSEHGSSRIPVYDVIPHNNGQNSQFQRVVAVGGPTEYETMIHPKSNMDMMGGYVQMSRAPQPNRTAPSNPISVPLPSTGRESYNTLQHFPARQSPQSSSVNRNNYDTLPTIREAPKAQRQESPSNYENHPLPQDIKSIASQVYSPSYQNVELARQDRRGSLNQDQYENVDTNGEQIKNSNGNNNGAGRRLSMRRRDSDREDVKLPVNGNGPSVGGVEVESSPPKTDGYVKFQPRDMSSAQQVPSMGSVEYTKINHQSTAVIGTMRQERAGVHQHMVRSES